MHLHNALVIAENYSTEWFHNIIANVFQVFLVDTLVLPTHIFKKLEPKIIL